jgi:putative polyhydroxyalkanoate system protein
MADIDVRRVHALGVEGARKVADKLAADLGRKFDLRGDWKGNILHFERPGVTGSLAVGERDLHLTVALGFLLKAMKGSIERDGPRRARQAAAPPYAEERRHAEEKGSASPEKRRLRIALSRASIVPRNSSAPPIASKAWKPRSRKSCRLARPASFAGRRMSLSVR